MVNYSVTILSICLNFLLLEPPFCLLLIFILIHRKDILYFFSEEFLAHIFIP